MPSTCCSVPYCSNRGGHLFPKSEKLKKKWIKAIKRNMDGNKFQLWKPTKTSVVCKLHFIPSDYISETTCGTVALVKRLKSDAIPSVFPWISASNSSPRTKRQDKRMEAKASLDSDTDSSSESGDDLPSVLPFDDDNVGNEIIYTAEPIYEDVEMRECNANIQTFDDTSTQTSTWPSLCVEKFIYDSPGIMFYTGLQTYEDFSFALATLGNAAYELNICITEASNFQ